MNKSRPLMPSEGIRALAPAVWVNLQTDYGACQMTWCVLSLPNIMIEAAEVC